MRLSRAEIQGFRCLDDVDLNVGDLTILLGSNSTGKSSALRALKFFFESDQLEPADVYGRTDQGRVVVRLRFGQLSRADRDAFGPYAQGDQMVLTRIWEDGETKTTGRGLRFPDFDNVKGQQGRQRTAAYRELRAARSELGLPEANTMQAVDEAMLAWEMANPERCEVADRDAGALFGYASVGQSVISSRFKFVFVPGLRDAAEEATERKGSLLERLLSAIAEQRAQADEQLTALERETRERYAEVIEQSHGPTLRGLAERLEGHVRRYVPNASIALQPVEAPLKVGPPLVALRGGEAHDLSDLGRQGHGFQRTFIIAALEYLAETAATVEDGADRPTLFFAIEEPELFQHPPRARHFFNTLRSLAFSGQSVQVCYATHSPYFVSAQDYPSIRVFRRTAARGEEMPAGASVTVADVETVARALPEERRPEIGRYLARTMRDAFCEAFFARAAVLVEGAIDAAVVIQAARLMGVDLVSEGVVFVPVTKSVQPLALAILNALGVPTYTIFDGDSDQGDAHARSENHAILAQLGEAAIDFPPTGAHDRWACFSTNLEDFLERDVDGFGDLLAEVRNDFGWSRQKAPEIYGEAVERLGQTRLPPLVNDVVTRIRALLAD